MNVAIDTQTSTISDDRDVNKTRSFETETVIGLAISRANETYLKISTSLTPIIIIIIIIIINEYD